MPACPRSETINRHEVGVYHCYSRCVRQAYLCGKDPSTGIDYEYRRQWIQAYQEVLAGLFAIEIGFRAELSNHLHLILRNRPDIVKQWSDEEVAWRYLSINLLTKSSSGKVREVCEAEVKILARDKERIEEIRTALADPSCFMARLNEYVARRCNREDGTTGSFWDGRFGARNLVDEAAILICGIYIDLNQVRAGEASTPEASTHTSAHTRIKALQQRYRAAANGKPVDAAHLEDGWLCELTLKSGRNVDVTHGLRSLTGRRASDKGLLDMTTEEYLSLLDASGRILREGKGAIPAGLAPILERIGIKAAAWSECLFRGITQFGRIMGSAKRVRSRADAAARRYYRGLPCCRQVFC